jgi:hypothetical protein
MVTRNDPPTCAGDEICQRKTPTYCEGDYSREFNYGCQTYCSCHEDSPTGSIDGMCDYCCAVVDGNCQREEPTVCDVDNGYSRDYNYGCNSYCECSSEPGGICNYCCKVDAGYCYRETPTTQTVNDDADRCQWPSPPPSPPSPPPPSPAPPPHDVADWGGYTPVPASATLTDVRMCDGCDTSFASSKTLAQCRASCDSWSSCLGFSWGLFASPPAPPSPPPYVLDRRRTLLAHDEPAVANVTGTCFLMTSTPTSSSIDSVYFTSAGCYAKGARLPPT